MGRLSICERYFSDPYLLSAWESVDSLVCWTVASKQNHELRIDAFKYVWRMPALMGAIEDAALSGLLLKGVIEGVRRRMLVLDEVSRQSNETDIDIFFLRNNGKGEMPLLDRRDLTRRSSGCW